MRLTSPLDQAQAISPDPDPPDLKDRRFTRAACPELFETLIEQSAEPFTATTSTEREHTAATSLGEMLC